MHLVGWFIWIYTVLWLVYCTLTEVLLNLTEVLLTLAEVFPCFFLSCKPNARVKLAKTGHGPYSSTLFVLFYVLFVCKCVLYYCHRVATQLQLINVSSLIKYDFPTTKQECPSLDRDVWRNETSHIITKQGNSIARLLVINTLTLWRVPKTMSTYFSFYFSPTCESTLLCLTVSRPNLFVPVIRVMVKWSWVEWYRGTPKHSEKLLSQCHFVRHMSCPRKELCLPRLESV
jgi:hypothetical protein